MRGAGWVIYALAILIATQALLTCKGSDSLAKPHRPIAALVAIGLVTLIVLAAAWPPAENTKSSDGALTAVTFTIRYGYDNAWHYRLDEIATAIERVNADIVTLQEADTGRLTSYGTDTVLYLARRLRMNVVYWPTVEHLTGIAILHRLPTAGYDSQLLTSIKEQTGVLHVHLQPGGRDLDVYGTWLGIRGENTLRQVNEIVQFIGDKRPTILGGAFFAMQDSPIYTAVNDAGFDFVALGLGLPPPPDAIDPAHHVDYVWTRGLKPLRGWTPGGPAMNHAMVAVQFELP
jgi:endonuclease/exonuclease/phosphatase family metal-dependent hydrolase